MVLQTQEEKDLWKQVFVALKSRASPMATTDAAESADAAVDEFRKRVTWDIPY